MTTVFIISAPSGSGKSTLVNRLLTMDPRLDFSISYTTRSPRGAERDGVDYFYISRSEFEDRIARNEFLEYAEVFGNYYGTHIGFLDRARAQEHDLVLDIDVQGARQLRMDERARPYASIFILAPSRQVLEQRLRARSEDAEAVIERRLREAATEIRNFGDYDYIVVNEEIAHSVRLLRAIVDAERVRRDRVQDGLQSILATFETVSPREY
jgi:guanylate kinase